MTLAESILVSSIFVVVMSATFSSPPTSLTSMQLYTLSKESVGGQSWTSVSIAGQTVEVKR